ncbi:hypothetical protein FB382_002913 [Nocardioides ginsengisegetis]|uniref:Uncharacterized protein n=1 Tax=Nocardioides ginsengisegetis TaxID=661491 RepID=A0A7W3J1P7_9ACTN|nr:hypothetical protein [Nocardioides ginsengisegetis]MBA8804622.1 hypothetical protein [Nocardioides ginsengisegetis]
MPVTRFLVVAGTGTGAAALAVLLVALTAPTILSASPARPAHDQTPGRSAAVRPERAAVESGAKAGQPARHREAGTSPGTSTAPAPAGTPASPTGQSPGAERRETGPTDDTLTSRLPRTGRPTMTLRQLLRHAMPGSHITSSSVSPSDGVLQVALTASTSRRPSAVLRWWRIHLARLGLHEVTTRAVAGSEAAAFHLGRSSATVTVTRPGGARETTYSVFALLSDRRT